MMTRMNALPHSFLKAATRADARLTREMMESYVASVRADVLTPECPEAVAYMRDTGGSFEDFVHDEGFVCAMLGVPFLWDAGIDITDGRIHRDARLVVEAF